MNYYDYGSGYYDRGVTTGFASIMAGLGIYMLFISAVGIFMLVCMWKIFKKAGVEGWKSIIPIYNIIVLLEIVELPVWYIALFFVPLANIYAIFKIYIELAHKFGKSTVFGVAMVFFGIICLPILAFGKNGYIRTKPIVNNGYANNQNNNNVYNYSNVEHPVQQTVQYPNVAQPVQQTVQYPNVEQPVQQTVQYPNVAQPAQQTMQYPNVEQPVQQTMQYSNVGTQENNITQSNMFVNQGGFNEQNNASNVKVCPSCGTKIDANSSVCFMCGKQI